MKDSIWPPTWKGFHSKKCCYREMTLNEAHVILTFSPNEVVDIRDLYMRTHKKSFHEDLLNCH